MKYKLYFPLILLFIAFELNMGVQITGPIRNPAAIDTSSCVDLVQDLIALNDFSTLESKRILEELHQLQPNLSMRFLKQKVSAIDDQFMFYRSFVPYFYRRLQNNLPTIKIPENLQAIKGNVLGDLHMDNFGALIKKRNELFYGANDPDYGNKLPVYSDVLRYLTGIHLNMKKISNEDFKKIYMAYKAGLKNDTTSVKIPKKIKSLSASQLGPAADELDQNGRLVREVKKYRVPVELEEEEIGNLKNLIEQQLGSSLEVKDSFKFLNVTGGSGGYMRFRFLVELPSGSEFLPSKQIIELKEIPENLRLPLSDSALNLDETLARIYKLDDPELKKFYGVLRGDNTEYLMRPRWEQMDFPGVSSMKGKKKQSYLEYQAYLIGTYHRNSLQQNSQYVSYLKEIEKLKAKSLRDWSQKMAKMVESDFAELNK